MVCQRLLAAGIIVGLASALVSAAELQERTRLAYDSYAEQARQYFLEHVPTDSLRWPGAGPARTARLRSGVIVAGPSGEDGIIGVPGGLVHHWVGAAFIPDVTLDHALILSQTYAEYPAIYESVISAQVLGREDEAFLVLLRLEERTTFVTARLDVWSDVLYVRLNSNRAYSVSNATEIRQVANAGRPDERLLPAGNDSGYLWRAHTFTKYVERDGGVYVELETLGLSRGFPLLLGWLIEPIARRVGRKSVEGSLMEFRKALVTSG